MRLSANMAKAFNARPKAVPPAPDPRIDAIEATLRTVLRAVGGLDLRPVMARINALEKSIPEAIAKQEAEDEAKKEAEDAEDEMEPPEKVDLSPVLARLDRLEACIEALLKAPQPQKEKTAYDFDIQRNLDGSIKHIRAKPASGVGIFKP